MADLKTTRQAAQHLGMNYATFYRYIWRNVELRPAMQLDSTEMLWTDEEIEAVRVRRAVYRPPGRKGRRI